MNDIKLRIDTRYFRMCIHRHALKIIGDPDFINFGYDPESMRLMVMGSWVDDRKSVRVRQNKQGSVYVFSKPLLIGIRKVSNILTATASYIVEGTVSESERIIIFPLKEAQITAGEPSEEAPDNMEEIAERKT